MKGWIKLHRKLSENPLWLIKPFSRGQAWVDLLMLANHKPGFFYVRDVKVNISRGQVGKSEPKLAERWGWSRSRVRKFLKDLIEEQQVIIEKRTVTLVVTIVNFEEYQKKEQQQIQQEIQQPIPQDVRQQYISSTSAVHQQDPNKNVKNDKNYLFRERYFSILEIFYFKNYKRPINVTNNFYRHYESTNWKNGSDVAIESIESVAGNWKNKLTDGLNCPPPFLEKWEILYLKYKKLNLSIGGVKIHHHLLAIRPATLKNGTLLLRGKKKVLHEIRNNSALREMLLPEIGDIFGVDEVNTDPDKREEEASLISQQEPVITKPVNCNN